MTDDSLNWLAMQYVLDELPEVERAAFELRLENDLAACEAVAQASQLQLGLEQAFETNESLGNESLANENLVSVAAPQSSHLRQSTFAIVAVSTVLACLLLVALSVPSRVGKQDLDFASMQMTKRILPTEHENIELVSLWRSGMASPEADIEDAEEVWQDPPGQDALPSWLLAGVSLELSDSNPAMPQHGKGN